MEELRREGIRAGLFRPITLWPFPTERLAETCSRVGHVLVVEMSAGQMLEDVRLTVGDRAKIGFHGRMGGTVPSVSDVVRAAKALLAEPAGGEK
jgi:2-oxoglutarate ferredoxin oxidoreductase subunit alpha